MRLHTARIALGLAGLTICSFIACNKDDDTVATCIQPTVPTTLPDCVLAQIEVDRPDDMPDVIFKVDLYRRGDAYYYALLPDNFRLPIKVYNACCTFDCQLGVAPGTACTWLAEAEDLGTIYKE